MKHLKTFAQISESAAAEGISPILKKLESKDTKGLILALMPYKNLLKPYYDKYYINGEIRADLIEADIRRMNFTAKANEEYGGLFGKQDYADNMNNPLLFRVLHKVFVRFPKSVVGIIADWFRDTVDEFKSGSIGMGLLNLLIGAVTAFIVFIMCVGAYQCGDWLFNGLDRGIAKGGAEFEPGHYETHVHHVKTGNSSHTYTTHDWVPDRWHVEVQGIGEESQRIENWKTYSREAGDAVWKGDTLTNDDDWTWEGTE